MKLKNLAMACLFSGLLFSCTDDISYQSEVELPTKPNWDANDIEDKTGYIALSLNVLDSGTGSTRATYDTGEAWEREIINFRVYVFKANGVIDTKAKEDEAEYVGYAEWKDPDYYGENEGMVYQQVKKYNCKVNDLLKTNILFPEETITGNYYAVVMANFNDDCYNYVDEALDADKKFSTLSNMTFDKTLNWISYDSRYQYFIRSGSMPKLTMTSAAYWQPGDNSSSKDPLLLVPIDLTKIQFVRNSELSTTYLSNAATFYIQRNVVKITLSEDSKGITEYTIDQGPNSGVKIELISARVSASNHNTKSFLFQNTSGLVESLNEISQQQNESVLSRFHSKVDNNFDQVNWAIDPNYDSEQTKDSYTNFRSGQTGLGLHDPSMPSPEFFLENTSEPNGMRIDWSTYFGFNVNYYIKNGSGTYDKNPMIFIFKGDETMYTEEILKAKIKKTYSDFKSLNLNILSNKRGKITDFINSVNPSSITVEDIAKVFNINPEEESCCCIIYSGMTYLVPIRHFTDEEMGNVYPNYDSEGKVIEYDSRHLGRYGVVRNHWYELKINSFRGPGYPNSSASFEYEDNHFDDLDLNSSAAISYSINLVNWTKHSQVEDF